jgi:uncharacterized protein YciI
MRMFSVILAASLFAGAAAAQNVDPLFILEYRQGPAWKVDAPPRLQSAMTAHGAYMKKLFDTGVTLVAGPTTDTPGGLVIIHADSLDQAKAILASDPSITSGMFVAEVHPWSPVFRVDKPLPPSHLDIKRYGDQVLPSASH